MIKNAVNRRLSFTVLALCIISSVLGIGCKRRQNSALKGQENVTQAEKIMDENGNWTGKWRVVCDDSTRLEVSKEQLFGKEAWMLCEGGRLPDNPNGPFRLTQDLGMNIPAEFHLTKYKIDQTEYDLDPSKPSETFCAEAYKAIVEIESPSGAKFRYCREIVHQKLRPTIELSANDNRDETLAVELSYDNTDRNTKRYCNAKDQFPPIDGTIELRYADLKAFPGEVVQMQTCLDMPYWVYTVVFYVGGRIDGPAQNQIRSRIVYRQQPKGRTKLDKKDFLKAIQSGLRERVVELVDQALIASPQAVTSDAGPDSVEKDSEQMGRCEDCNISARDSGRFQDPGFLTSKNGEPKCSLAEDSVVKCRAARKLSDAQCLVSVEVMRAGKPIANGCNAGDVGNLRETTNGQRRIIWGK